MEGHMAHALKIEGGEKICGNKVSPSRSGGGVYNFQFLKLVTSALGNASQDVDLCIARKARSDPLEKQSQLSVRFAKA